MVWWKPYEALLEAKPVPAKEVLLDMIAQELVDMCLSFPPPADSVTWFDASLRDKWAFRFGELPQIDGPMAALIGKLVSWDLQHEIEAIDHFVRNRRWRRVCATELHWGAVQLCWRTGLELLYQRKEDCGGLLTTADLVRIVARFTDRSERKLSSAT